MIMSRREHRRQTVKKLAIGGAIAGVAGYMAGVLTAPKSGKQTRRDIRDAADKGVAGAEKELKKLQAELDKVMSQAKTQSGKAGDKAKQEGKQLLDKAKIAKDKTGSVLSAVQKGDAEDKDLKQAIDDAKTSISHLKNYLKK